MEKTSRQAPPSVIQSRLSLVDDGGSIGVGVGNRFGEGMLLSRFLSQRTRRLLRLYIGTTYDQEGLHVQSGTVLGPNAVASGCCFVYTLD